MRRNGERGQLEQRVLVLVTLSLVAFGLVMVFSATSASAAIGNGDPMTYLVKQGLYALAGLALLVVLSRVDYHRVRPLAPMLLVGALVLCAAVLVVAPTINGAKRWFLLGPVSVQPPEVAKLALCIWLCWHLSKRRPARTLGELMRPVGWVVLVFAGLIMLEPDLGTTIALMLMVTAVLVVSGLPTGLLLRAGAIAVALAGLAIWMEPYRRARFFAFLDPWDDPQGDGFQIVQALIGIGSGGVTGNGLGEGVAKVFYLPEAHTDMIFAIIGDELGLVGSTFVICAFAAFAWAGFRIGLRCRDPFGKRLAVGITALVAGQAVVNLAAVLAVAPLTGIPLPFVSYGGSSLIVLLSGLPAAASFSVGSAIRGGGWSVTQREAERLAVSLPADASGRLEMTIELRTLGDEVIASARTQLVVVPAAPPKPAIGDAPRTDEAEVARLVAEGKRLMSAGHVAQARLALRRAADAGNGEAARQLGDSYDPAKLFALGVRGMDGDIEKAIYWYERADELGDPHAKARLLSLGSR